MWRPVERGLCKAESLFDGTFDLCDIARMNEVLDISAENAARAQAAAEKNSRR